MVRRRERHNRAVDAYTPSPEPAMELRLRTQSDEDGQSPPGAQRGRLFSRRVSGRSVRHFDIAQAGGARVDRPYCRAEQARMIVSDNGTELTFNAVLHGVGKPGQNGTKPFRASPLRMRASRGWASPAIGTNERMREKLLNEALLMSLDLARVVITDWINNFNREQPQPSLGYAILAAFGAEREKQGAALLCMAGGCATQPLTSTAHKRNNDVETLIATGSRLRVMQLE
jgi:hypothetical protein